MRQVGGSSSLIKVYIGAMTHDACIICVFNVSVVFVELMY